MERSFVEVANLNRSVPCGAYLAVWKSRSPAKIVLTLVVIE